MGFKFIITDYSNFEERAEANFVSFLLPNLANQIKSHILFLFTCLFLSAFSNEKTFISILPRDIYYSNDFRST